VLNLTFESARRVVTVRCQGRIVCGLESALFSAAFPHHRQDIILVDLSGVTAIDAAGLGALLSLRAAVIYLRLVDPSETVLQVLRLTNLDSVFDISESECRKDAAWQRAHAATQSAARMRQASRRMEWPLPQKRASWR
jgi:anti-anti-sigma factor